MDVIISFVLLIIGFIFLVKGADYFVASSSSIARRFHVSPLVIGLTLVAFGTSLPELAVSFVASLTVVEGATADIAMGNVVGSNIVNITLILGFTALARPVKVSKTMHKKEFPYLIFSTVLILVLSLYFQSDTRIIWWEALILLVAFIGYSILMIKSSKGDIALDEIPNMNIKKATFLLIIGIAGVSIGGWMVTRGAEQISTSILVTFFGMTLTKATTLVGLSVVSIGTSLPEMLTSVVAAKKGENEIAFGNLVGSNVFNILFIIGLSGLVTPLGINGDVMIDMYLMLGVTVLALVMAMTKNIVTKKEGVLLIIVYAFYLIYIILRALAIV